MVKRYSLLLASMFMIVGILGAGLVAHAADPAYAKCFASTVTDLATQKKCIADVKLQLDQAYAQQIATCKGNTNCTTKVATPAVAPATTIADTSQTTSPTNTTSQCAPGTVPSYQSGSTSGTTCVSDGTQSASGTCSASATFFGIPAWYRYLPVETDPATGDCGVNTDGLTVQKVVTLILLAVVNIVFSLGAVVAVVFVVYGGFMFVTSQGEPAKIVSARKTILNAVIGLLIVLLASQLVKFIAKFLSTTNKLTNTKLFAESIIGTPEELGIPTTSATDLKLKSILMFAFGLVAAISFLVIVIAGFKYVISIGDPAKITTARKTITYALIGLIISLSATTIVAFVIGQS